MSGAEIGMPNGKTLTLNKIDCAPVSPGAAFGPCLLGPGSDDDWIIGRWNGEGWFSAEGFRVYPKLFALLPMLDTILGLWLWVS